MQFLGSNTILAHYNFPPHWIRKSILTSVKIFQSHCGTFPPLSKCSTPLTSLNTYASLSVQRYMQSKHSSLCWCLSKTIAIKQSKHCQHYLQWIKTCLNMKRIVNKCKWTKMNYLDMLTKHMVPNLAACKWKSSMLLLSLFSTALLALEAIKLAFSLA